ncbi:DUF7679 family protein [Enterococcus cecorum]|uniref:DUF7679 family protein n=1 Tax=Enterococcus cecorum TaxID=44008 RepID=UPI001FAD7C4C|nr:hypothetical protein [Enterococcus cecorum]MCJ0601630.1 hypothetical protein [Enterococcus cecorum]
MVKKKRKKFCVRVRCLNRRSYQFPLPNDLQKAMWQYKTENPTNWFDLLSQALINIPTKEYRENYQPPMTVTLVEKIFITANYDRVATRGQFVTKDNWQRNDLSRHWNNIRFLQHDYPLMTKLRIFLVYLIWMTKLHIRRIK